MAQWLDTALHGFDYAILAAIHDFAIATGGFFDWFMLAITSLANDGLGMIALGLVLFCFKRTRKTGMAVLFAIAVGALITNVTLKPLVARIRPYDLQEELGVAIKLLIDAQHDFSFPSGHTIASFEAATAIAIHNKKWGIPALVLACLIAFSRLYLYVHYPTDVLASVVLGIGFAFLGSWMVKKGYEIAKK